MTSPIHPRWRIWFASWANRSAINLIHANHRPRRRRHVTCRPAGGDAPRGELRLVAERRRRGSDERRSGDFPGWENHQRSLRGASPAAGRPAKINKTPYGAAESCGCGGEKVDAGKTSGKPNADQVMRSRATLPAGVRASTEASRGSQYFDSGA